MPLILVETRISAPRPTCFDLARSVTAHIASTAKTQERPVAGRMEGLFELGDQVTWEARHLGVRQRLTARISAMDRPVMFADDMVSGAFSWFHHVHEFDELAGGDTLMRDRFEFASPLGPLGWIANRLFLTKYMRRFLETRAAYPKEEAERVARAIP